MSHLRNYIFGRDSSGYLRYTVPVRLRDGTTPGDEGKGAAPHAPKRSSISLRHINPTVRHDGKSLRAQKTNSPVGKDKEPRLQDRRPRATSAIEGNAAEVGRAQRNTTNLALLSYTRGRENEELLGQEEGGDTIRHLRARRCHWCSREDIRQNVVRPVKFVVAQYGRSEFSLVSGLLPCLCIDWACLVGMGWRLPACHWNVATCVTMNRCHGNCGLGARFEAGSPALPCWRVVVMSYPVHPRGIQVCTKQKEDGCGAGGRRAGQPVTKGDPYDNGYIGET